MRRNGWYGGWTYGRNSPQIQTQFNLLLWGLEFDIGRWFIGGRIGPLAVKVWL